MGLSGGGVDVVVELHGATVVRCSQNGSNITTITKELRSVNRIIYQREGAW